MQRVIITGGPGVGKTTLLGALAAKGYAIVGESARAIIAERLARGLSPRPEAGEFAREILRRDKEKYRESAEQSGWIFFDRSVIEALGMLNAAAPLTADELAAALWEYPFHSPVFILPPWETIYTTDSERDHSFAWVEQVHTAVTQWYRSCGYEVCEVPKLPVAERVEFVLDALGM